MNPGSVHESGELFPGIQVPRATRSRNTTRGRDPFQEIDSLLSRGRAACRPGQKDHALTSILALAAPLGLPSGLGTFILPIGLLVVLYLLMIRPQQKRQQKWQQMLTSLKPGDRVTTTGGLRGIILSIKDDSLQLRVPPDNLRIEVVKNAIASVTQDDAK